MATALGGAGRWTAVESEWAGKRMVSEEQVLVLRKVDEC